MVRRPGYVLLLLVSLIYTMTGFGCASKRQCCDRYAVAPTLLFGREPTAALATRIGRDPWPVTAGRVQGVEDTVYLEYYRDNFGGNNWSDYNNPVRQFRSYRVGAQQN